MTLDGKSSVQLVNLFKEPPRCSNDVEDFDDMDSLATSNSFESYLSHDSSGLAAVVHNPKEERTLVVPSGSEDTFSYMDPFSDISPGGLRSDSADTSMSILQTASLPFFTSSSSPTICLENPQGIQVPLQPDYYDQIFKPSVECQDPDSSPQGTAYGLPNFTLQRTNFSADNRALPSTNVAHVNSIAVDHMEEIRMHSPIGLLPASVTHDKLSRHSVTHDSEYVTGNLTLYNNDVFIPGFQNLMGSTSQLVGLSSRGTSDYLDLALHTGNNTGQNELGGETIQRESFTPFLDLQTQQLGTILSESNGRSAHPWHEFNPGESVMDVGGEGPIVSISRSLRHRSWPNNDNTDNSDPLHKSVPSTLIPPEPASHTPLNPASPNPHLTVDRTVYAEAGSNILNNNSQSSEDVNASELNRCFAKTPSETFGGSRPIKPILVKPFQRQDKKKGVEGTPAPESHLRRPKSLQGSRQPKKYHFRPICPSISYQTRVGSSSPSSSSSTVDLPQCGNPPRSPTMSLSTTSSVPKDTPSISIASNNQSENFPEIFFNRIAPKSATGVADRTAGVAFAELKLVQFGFKSVSEILEDAEARPFLKYDRMNELFVLLEWSFPSGLMENSQEHKIVKFDRPINNLRRFEILCKIAKKLYDYIQKEATIPLDPKKLCILSLYQRLDRKWIVRIGLNNSQRA